MLAGEKMRLDLKIGVVVSVDEERRNRIMKSVVVGFFGARDGYEVPLALQEGGLLSTFITDIYGARGGAGLWKKQFAMCRNWSKAPKLLSMISKLVFPSFSQPPLRIESCR